MERGPLGWKNVKREVKLNPTFFRMRILQVKKSEFKFIFIFSKLYEYSLKIVMILETDL